MIARCDALPARPDHKAFARLNMEFFSEISAMTGNQPLREISERLYFQTSRIVLKLMPRLNLAEEFAAFRREMEDMLAALEIGDLEVGRPHPPQPHLHELRAHDALCRPRDRCKRAGKASPVDEEEARSSRPSTSRPTACSTDSCACRGAATNSAWGNLMIPIAVIRNGDGPTALLTGANHGDEYEGPIALTDLARTLPRRRGHRPRHHRAVHELSGLSRRPPPLADRRR